MGRYITGFKEGPMDSRQAIMAYVALQRGDEKQIGNLMLQHSDGLYFNGVDLSDYKHGNEVVISDVEFTVYMRFHKCVFGNKIIKFKNCIFNSDLDFIGISEEDHKIKFESCDFRSTVSFLDCKLNTLSFERCQAIAFNLVVSTSEVGDVLTSEITGSYFDFGLHDVSAVRNVKMRNVDVIDVLNIDISENSSIDKFSMWGVRSSGRSVADIRSSKVRFIHMLHSEFSTIGIHSEGCKVSTLQINESAISSSLVVGKASVTDIDIQSCENMGGLRLLNLVDKVSSCRVQGCSITGGVNIGGSSFERLSFKGTSFQGIFQIDDVKIGFIPDFTDCLFSRAPSLEMLDFPQELYGIRASKADLRRMRYQLPLVRKLRLIAEQGGNNTLAKSLFAMEVDSSSREGWEYFPALVYRALSNYGRSISRPLWWLLGIWILSIGVLLLKADIDDGWADLIAPVGLISLGYTMPLPVGSSDAILSAKETLFPDGLPAGMTILFWIQSLISYVLIFLAGLGIRNRFRI